MNPLAGILVKITIKQETYKHTDTHKILPKTIFLSGCFRTCIFHKKIVTIDERKCKKRLKNKSMSKI